MASNKPKRNRAHKTLADERLIDGLNRHPQWFPSFAIGGAMMTTQTVIALLQSRIDASKATVAAQAAWLALLHAENQERTRTDAAVAGLKQVVLVAFAGQIDALADFGLSPRKARVLSPEQQLLATARGKATRLARHTMGKNQRAAIKGVVAPEQAAPDRAGLDRGSPDDGATTARPSVER
jgi:hypothetical protein